MSEDDKKRAGWRVLEGGTERELKRNVRRPKVKGRRRQERVKKSSRREPKVGRYVIKRVSSKEGYGSAAHIARRSQSTRAREKRRRGLRFRKRNREAVWDLRARTEEEKDAIWECGVEEIRHTRIGAELKYWEPFLDGYYAELMPDGRRRWDHLQDGDADNTLPEPDWDRGLDTWRGELFGDDESI